MGVYIRGMEMPVDCLNCKFCNTDFVEPYCRLLMRKMQIGERREDCPLIPVPEPHGRLIDADAILGKINAIISAHPDEADLYEQDAVIVKDWLRSEPTVIESEGGNDDAE